MRKAKIVYWVSTLIIFLSEGVAPALTSQSDLARESIRHLGYPDYFGTMFTVFKVIGALVLIIPKFPARVKEWAYAGFAIDFISAFVSICVVDGFGWPAILPIVAMLVLAISYIYYHRLHS